MTSDGPTPEPALDDGRRAARRLRIGFGVIWLVALSPTLTLDPFPSQDGPSHVYAARAIDGVLSGERPYTTLYEADLSPSTNWLGGMILYALGHVVSLDTAERLLIVLFVTVFSAGWWRLARRPNGVVRSPVVLFGPFFATGMTLHLGFYSYSVGLALLPWAWALAAGSVRSLALAGALATVAWFGHVLPAAFASLGIVVIGASVHTDAPRWRRVLAAALSALPSAVLSLEWLFTRPPALVPNTHLDPMTLLEAVATLRPLSAWVGTTELIATAMALIFAAFVVGGQWVSRLQKASPPAARLAPWWVLAGTTLLAYLLLPEGGQGFWFVSERLGLYPWLALLPIAAHVDPYAVMPSARLAKALTAVIITICVLFGHLCWLSGRLLEEGQARSVRAMSYMVERGTNSILLDFSTSEGARFRPYLHLLGRVAATHSAIDASTHEPHTDHFQLRLRPQHGFPSPERLLGSPESLTRHDLRNICTLVSVGATAAWVARIEGEGWAQVTMARDEQSRTLTFRRQDPFCTQRVGGSGD